MRSLGASTPRTRRGSVKSSLPSLRVLRQFLFVPSVLNSSAMAEREKLNKITEAIIGAAMLLPATRIHPLPNARSRRPPQRYTLGGWPGGPSTSKEEVSMNTRKHSNDHNSGEPGPALDRRGFLTAATGLASAALWAKGAEADGAP